MTQKEAEHHPAFKADELLLRYPAERRASATSLTAPPSRTACVEAARLCQGQALVVAATCASAVGDLDAVRWMADEAPGRGLRVVPADAEVTWTVHQYVGALHRHQLDVLRTQRLRSQGLALRRWRGRLPSALSSG